MTVLPQLRCQKLEMSIPEEVSLRVKPRQIEATANDDDEDNASITSEISLEFLAKERENERAAGSQSSSACWNPDGSDYTLDHFLRSKDCEDQSANDSATDSLMTSDYSLNIRLSKSQHSLKTSMSSCLGTSQHSLDSFASFSTTRTNKSIEKDLSVCPDAEAGSKEGARVVSFFPRTRIHRLPNRRSMLRAERKHVWYDREELKTIRQECFETIHLIQDGGLIDEDEGMCSLGLEYKTAENYKSRQRNKREVREVVFDEQEFQRENGLVEPEWIARVSMEQSTSSVQSALVTAKAMQEDIMVYLGLADRYH